jgi:Ca2+-binding RTX toxin-like protein
LSNNLVGTGATIKGGSGVDTITGGAGGDTITANSGADDLSGGDGADTIDGGAGNDDIEGDAGNDNLIGGAGNDTITGGTGTDTLTLGAGNDIVELATASTDTVTDFVFGAIEGDIIDLSTAGNDAAVDLFADTDGTARVLSATSTGAIAGADNEVLFVTVAAIASLDTKAEIAAIFATGKVFAAVTAADQFTLLIRDEATSKVYIYDLEEGTVGGNTVLSDSADTVELIGILNNVSATAFDSAVVANFQQ